MHLSPPSSFLASARLAQRCGQASCMKPTRPSVARKATKFSPNKRTRSGAPAISSLAERHAGTQYSRRNSPIDVSGPTRVKSSFCSGLSMFELLIGSVDLILPPNPRVGPARRAVAGPCGSAKLPFVDLASSPENELTIYGLADRKAILADFAESVAAIKALRAEVFRP